MKVPEQDQSTYFVEAPTPCHHYLCEHCQAGNNQHARTKLHSMHFVHVTPLALTTALPSRYDDALHFTDSNSQRLKKVTWRVKDENKFQTQVDLPLK